MTTKKTTTRPKARDKAAERRELAGLIYKVMHHPALPDDLCRNLYGVLNEFENTIDLTALCYSEAALTHAFELRAEEEGDARNV
jgi:hypothetical protein